MEHFDEHMEVEHAPLEDDFPLQTGELHFHVS